MYYKVRRDLTFNYSISGYKYSYNVRAGDVMKFNDSKTERVKGKKYKSISIRSLLNPKETVFIVCCLAGETIPINDNTEEKIKELLKQDKLMEIKVNE